MASEVHLADQPVRDEIATSLDANLCVEAGAGTGKTTALVRRIVEVLCRGRATIDELVVITFTEKAAAELSVRVRQALEQAAKGEAGKRAQLARTALEGVHRARIETLHAFAAALLRERPVEARLDPGFAVLDEVAAELDFEREQRAWLHELYSGEDPTLVAMLDRGFGLEELRATAAALHRHRGQLPLRAPSHAPLDLDAFVAELSARVSALRALDDDCVEESDAGHRQLAELFAFADRCARDAGDRAALVRHITGATPELKDNCGARPNWSPGASLVAVKSAIKDKVKPLLERACERLRTEAMLMAMPLAEAFVARAAEDRRAAGRADFDDLLIWARDLLRDDADVRAFFQRRYTCVLIDEFQDTDPVQEQLAILLCRDQHGNVRPGALFIVGDPKQSIYRFRGADIALYEAVRREVLADGQRTIHQNFRSVGGILDWVNRVFDRVFAPVDGVQPANVPLAAERPEAVRGSERPPVVVVHGSGTPQAKDGPAIRAEEAPLLAALVRRAVLDERWPVEDPETGEVRPARWEDVAILMPARTGLDAYENALAAAGVPYRVEGRPELYSRPEVRELVALLTAIEDPTDSLSLVASLRSRAFACSDEDVAEWFAAGGRFDHRGGFDDVAGHESIRESLRTVRALHRRRTALTLVDLISEVLASTAMIEVSLLEPDGPRAAANLRKIVELARAFAASGEGGLRPFAAWLAAGRDDENAEADAIITEDGDPAVLVATMHSTKGLEFPIVCLAGCGAAQRGQSAPVPDREAGWLDVRVGTRATGRFHTPGFVEASGYESEVHDPAERLRLLYVAATRARDHLVIPVVPDRAHAGPLLAAMLPDLPAWDEARAGEAVDGCWLYDRRLLAPALAASPVADDREVSSAELDAALAEREAWVDERAQALARAAVGASVRTASGASGEDERDGEGLDAVDDVPAVVARVRDSARRLGDAVHQTLELVELPGAADLDAVAAAAASEHRVGERRDEVVELARACLASPSVLAAIASGCARREVAFTVCEPDGALIAGRADLVYREGEQLVVVDYKTDAVTASTVEERFEHHRPQAAVYAAALERATGLPVARVVFVFARAGVERAVSFAAAR